MSRWTWLWYGVMCTYIHVLNVTVNELARVTVKKPVAAVQEGKESLQVNGDPHPSKERPGTNASEALDPGGHEHHSDQQRRALSVFKYLLVFVAALESFAHGANDTANATGVQCHRSEL